MRINEANIFLFIAAVIIGILIAMNLSLDGQTRFLDVDQYNKAYEERTMLQEDVSELDNKYYELLDKIKEYDRNEKDSYKVVESMEHELKNNKMVLGLTPVEGDGFKIILNDSPLAETTGNYLDYLIHDTDLIKVINDLRNAGAEAIMVNGYRLTFTSSGVCVGSTISLDGIKISGPFTIVAIGNQEGMKTYFETQQNHLNIIKARGCIVEMEPVYDAKLPAYFGSLSVQYMRPQEIK